MSQAAQQVFRSREKHHRHPQKAQENNQIPAYIDQFNFREEVKLPQGQNREDWIAKHTDSIFRSIDALFQGITTFCTAQSCPTMTAGKGYKYIWHEQNHNRDQNNTLEVSAPDYIALLISYIQSNLSNRDFFPLSSSGNYPVNFDDIVKQIMNKAFRFYAHVYYHHMKQLKSANLDLSFNSSFRHFVFFVYEFNLIDKDQVEPLRDTIQTILQSK